SSSTAGRPQRPASVQGPKEGAVPVGTAPSSLSLLLGVGYSVHHSSSPDFDALAETGCFCAPDEAWPPDESRAGADRASSRGAGGGAATALGAGAATACRVCGCLSASDRPGIWPPSSWLICARCEEMLSFCLVSSS